MSLLSTTPSPSSLFSSSKHPNLHHNPYHTGNHPFSSFSLLPSSLTPLLSLSSSTRPYSRTFSSRSSSDKDDEWGQEPEPKSKSKRKPKPSSGGPRLPNFTISGSDGDYNDEWGDEPKPEPKPKPKSSGGPRVPNFTISGSNKEEEEEEEDDEWGEEPKPQSDPKPKTSSVELPVPNFSASIPDEWGDKSGPEPEPESKFSEPDPPTREDEDEWGPPTIDGEKTEVNKNMELKRCLLDSVYGSDFGFRTSTEVRAEVSELVTQLEAANSAPNPTEVPGLLDGNWILV